MNLRSQLIDVAAAHGLDGMGLQRLLSFSDVNAEPLGLPKQVPRILAVLAALMLGLGVIFWVAAHWGAWPRTARFALLQSLVLLAGLGAWLRPGITRAPLALLTLLAMGALFAFFGQTYQTGADPWQLFALWAALALPLAWAARSDLVWAPWVLVAMTGVTLWGHAAVGRVWRFDAQDGDVQAVTCLAAAAIVMLVGRRLQRFTGAGLWALRLAAWLFVSMVTLLGLIALFGRTVAPQYAVSLLVVAAACGWFASRPGYDLLALSVAALGLNVLVFAGLAQWLLRSAGAEPTGTLLMLGLVAAGSLAATVSLLMKRARLDGISASMPAAAPRAEPPNAHASNADAPNAHALKAHAPKAHAPKDEA